MQITLPENASAASLRRAEIAERLAATCPLALADEIALVGSTARGLADEDSDLELNLWAESIPPIDERVAWLQAAGASEWYVEEAPRRDQSYWIWCIIGDMKVEAGWQTFDALHETIDRILDGHDIYQGTLVFADIVTSAIPLRTTGQLQSWQAALNHYSDALQRSLIYAAVETWSWPDHLAYGRKIARRSERLWLTQSLLNDLEKLVRLLYAVHRRWEPSEKWTLTVARTFAPFDLDARIDAILGDPSLERRVELCARFCLDVLALVPPQYDVSAAVAALRAELD